LINHHQSSIANQQAAAAEKQQEGQWGISVLELYITHPDAFDPAKSPHADQNLNALAVSAPDVMKPILPQQQDALVRLGDPALTSSQLQTIAGALGAAQSAQGILSGIGKETTLRGLGGSLVPAAYSIYVKYGPNSADQAETVVNKLRVDGFRVPDPQPVEKSPSNPEVRYPAIKHP